MLEAPHRAAVQSISEIARDSGVDPSTLTRLGQRLGFQGFPELQELFRNHVVKRDGYYSSQTQQLLASYQVSGSKLARELADEEVKNVLDAASRLDEADLTKATDLLVNGRRIYVLGLRASFSVAYFFGSFLGFLRGDVIILGGAGFTLAEDLVHLTRGDVLVAIAFRRYTKATIAACRSAQARGVPIIAITDLSSPITQSDETGVTLVARSPYYFHAALADFFLVQVLLSAFAQRLGVDAVTGLGDLEELLLDLDVETD
jgi:DNA-binding MurR/RpiR family transcriptional regulator